MTVINIFGGPGVGKCLAFGTKVLMYDGSIRAVEDIKVGDAVMGPDSLPRVVIDTTYGHDFLYKITPIKGESYHVTGNHVLPLKYNKNGREKDVYVTANNFLNLSEYKQRRLKQYRVGVDFDYLDVLVDPYYIGLWLGDGASDNPTRITNIDTEVIQYLEQYSSSLGLQCKKVGNSIAYDITSGISTKGSNILRTSMCDYNLLGNKHIPDDYLINSRAIRLRLLAGLIDSDGHVSQNGCVEITQKNEVLADQIIFLARSLGFSAYKQTTTKSAVIGGTRSTPQEYFRCRISGDLYDIPTRIARKILPKRKLNKSVLRTGISVTRSNLLGNYCGIEVSGDNLYVLADFTVTHNSTTSAKLFARMKEKGYKVEYITEVAKDLVYSKDFFTLNDQLMVFSRQHHLLWKLRDQVDYVIVDSPLPLSCIYFPENSIYNRQDFTELVRSTYKYYNNINIVLKRDDEKHPYQSYGRTQTLEESIRIDQEVEWLLHDWDEDFTEYEVSKGTAKRILKGLEATIPNKPRWAKGIDIKELVESFSARHTYIDKWEE